MVMEFISRQAVMDTIQRYGDDHAALIEAVYAIPSFPAPNPNQEYDRNVMGQTEDEFWAAADALEQKEVAK